MRSTGVISKKVFIGGNLKCDERLPISHAHERRYPHRQMGFDSSGQKCPRASELIEVLWDKWFGSYPIKRYGYARLVHSPLGNSLLNVSYAAFKGSGSPVFLYWLTPLKYMASCTASVFL